MTLKKSLLTILCLALITISKAQTTSIQFINNSADNALQGINVYVNGIIVVPGLTFRSASSFITVPAGQPITIAVSDINGTLADTFYSITTTLSTVPVIKYVAVANGLISTTGYSPNKPFSLSIFNLARENSSLPNHTDIVFAHGCTDAPGTYDMRSGSKTLADDLKYDQFSADYVSMPATNYAFRMTNANGSQIFNTYQTIFDPQTNPDFENKTAVIVLSGFMNPSVNSNGPAFGLWVASSNGGPMFELDTTTPEAIARIQIAHNSADSVLDSVDLYIEGELRYDNFAYHMATPYIDLVGGVPTNISIAKKNSISISDTFFSFDATYDSARRYLAIMHGNETSGYTPPEAFEFTFYTQAQEATASPNTLILPINGSIDVGPYKILKGTTVIGNNQFYKNVPGYTTVGPTDEKYTVIKSSGNDTIETYEAQVDMLDFEGLAVTLLGSGFYDTAKNGLPYFHLFWVLPSGGKFIPLPIATISVEKLDLDKNLFTVWPNPAQDYLNIQTAANIKQMSGYILDISGKVVKTIPAITDNSIGISELNNGVYFLKIVSGEQYGYQKFIKE